MDSRRSYRFSLNPKALFVTALLMAAPAHADDFAEALASTYSKNPQILAAQAELRGTDELVAQAVSGFRPVASADVDRSRERTASGTRPWSYDNTTEKALSVSQPLFRGGRTLSAIKSARQQVMAGQATLVATEQRVLLDAVSAYTDVVEKQAVLALNLHNVEVLGKQREAAQLRFDVGELTRTDVAQAEARLSRAEADKRQAEGNLQAALATFQRVIGYIPQKSLDVPLTPPGLPATLDETQNDAQAMNPELIAALHLEESARADVWTQKGSLLPSVDLTGSMLRRDGGLSVAGTSGDFANDAITVGVSIPLYQSGAEYSRIREAKSRLQQASYNALDARNAVMESSRRTWEDYRTASAVIEATQDAIRAAQTALEGVSQENQFGTRTVLDVLDAEQELFTNRVALVQAQRNLTLQSYRLLASVGKLTARQLALNVAIYDPARHYDKTEYKSIGF